MQTNTDILKSLSSVKALANTLLHEATMLEQSLLAGGQPVSSRKGVDQERAMKTTVRYLKKRAQKHLK